MLCCWKRVRVATHLGVPDVLATFDRPFQCHISSLHGVPDTCLLTVRSPALHEKWGWSSAAHRWYWPLKVMGVFSKKNTNALSSARMLQTCLDNAEVCFGVKNEMFKALAARRECSDPFRWHFYVSITLRGIFGVRNEFENCLCGANAQDFRHHH